MIEDQSTLDEIGSVVAGGGQPQAIAKQIAQAIRWADVRFVKQCAQKMAPLFRMPGIA
ncbi:MAG: hypothetical protein ACRD4A_05970 [Candidatus Acidiferrales bacterium]